MEMNIVASPWVNIAEIEVSYKPKIKAKDRPLITCSKDLYEILIQRWDDNLIDLLEEFKLILLDNKSRVLGIRHIATGGVSGVVADPKIILGVALQGRASYLVVAHNHPSGKLDPSRQDIDLTNRLAQAAKLLDMRILDHLIITRDGYLSFADEGLL